MGFFQEVLTFFEQQFFSLHKNPQYLRGSQYRLIFLKFYKRHYNKILLRNFRKSHTAVTGLVLCINVFWLLPWALLTANDYLPGFYAMLIAYLPLVIIVTFMKAGRPEYNSNAIVL